MAYENMTYEAILARMMNRVQEQYPNLDNREGSIIFNALAPAAVELAIAYVELDNVRNQSFAETASREYLLKCCEQMGMDVSVFDASPSYHIAMFNVEVPIGSRWNCDLYNYKVTSFKFRQADPNGNPAYYYEVVCESTGSGSNNQQGSLTPITDSPSGLTLAMLGPSTIEGENEASDEDIRTAYFDYVNSVKSDGNVAQYKQWCNEYDGIGNSKIIPLWNGANTVLVSILSASNRAASSTLISNFQNYLDPGVTGMGNGVAPIGAFVTVNTASERTIPITATITLKSGYSDVSDAINEALKKYFASIAYEKTMVSYMTIGATILAVDGVESISNLKVDGGTSDITLETLQIPVVGATTWTVN